MGLCSGKRLLHGRMHSVVDVGASLCDTDSDRSSQHKILTGKPDLAEQRVMVLVKATGEAVSVLVPYSAHNNSPCSPCMLYLGSTEDVVDK
jgi:hypothetical protein